MSADAALPYRYAPAERTIPAMLRGQAARLGDTALFQCGDERWSYARTVEIAARMAGQLQSAGVVAGDRVAIFSKNRPEVLRLLLGAAWCGAIAVPINAAARGPQLRYVVENSGAKILAIEEDLLDVLQDAPVADLPIEHIWVFGTGASPCTVTKRVTPFLSDGTAVAPHAVRPETPFAILYTSGTTGPSKGVICPHAQFYWWAAYTCRFLDIRPGDVLTTTLPLFHTNAINTFFQALLSGSIFVVEPRFSVSDFWPAMHRTGATVSYLLGAMVPMLLSRPPTPGEKQHCLRTILAPGVPPALHAAFFARTGIALVDGYGSTETNFIIGTRTADRVDGQIGLLSPGVEARIIGIDGQNVPAGSAGELALRAADPLAFASGYFGMPDKTAEAWRDGWFHTGDRVRQETNGAFAFVDRLKDSIRRRGENISSFEVEAVLQSHPGVAVAAVFGVPDALADEEVMASVVLTTGAVTSAAELAAHCARLLPRYAVPRYIHFVGALPTTENGKVAKAELRQRGVTLMTWDRDNSPPST